MKKIVLVLLIALLVPQMVQAAWWNPVSWRIFNRSNNTKVLEDKVRELEKKLEEVSSLQSTTTAPTETYPKKPTPTPSVPKNNTPVLVPIVQVQQPAVVAEDYKKIYEDIVQKYTKLKSDIDKNRESINLNDNLESDKGHYRYLRELKREISEDLEDLKAIRNPELKDKDYINKYVNKYNSVYPVYVTSVKNHTSDHQIEALHKAKRTVIDYIKNNQNKLHLTSIHIEAARLLYLFDKVAGTKYSADFETKKTQVETIEFANRFLIDQD